LSHFVNGKCVRHKIAFKFVKKIKKERKIFKSAFYDYSSKQQKFKSKQILVANKKIFLTKEIILCTPY
jgi:hypothetical protein